MRTRQPWQTGVQSVCPRCKQQHVAEKTYSDTVEFRNLTLDLEGLQRYTCADCHFHWHTTEQTAHNQEVQRAAYQLERDRVRQRDGLLGSAEIAKAREALGLNQREAAQLFGGGFNAFNKYESGEVLQSQAMDRLLRLAVGLGKDRVVPMLEAISKGEPVVEGRGPQTVRERFNAYTVVIYQAKRSATPPLPAAPRRWSVGTKHVALTSRPSINSYQYQMQEGVH